MDGLYSGGSPLHKGSITQELQHEENLPLQKSQRPGDCLSSAMFGENSSTLFDGSFHTNVPEPLGAQVIGQTLFQVCSGGCF